MLDAKQASLAKAAASCHTPKNCGCCLSAPALEFASITKTFPGVKALKDVSLSVLAGSVRALVGENGAGKSTLLKILSGAYRPTSGSLTVAGQSRAFATTSDALAAGIAVIYQELHLVPEMTVAENIYLGHMPAVGGILNRRKLRELAAKQLQILGENINPDAKVSRLPIAQRQMVEIAKALTRGARILAFDEPTSSLSEREVRRLFAVIHELKSRGCAILYVSHRMEEIFEICDSVTVLRDGMHVFTSERTQEITRDILVQKMVGRDIIDVYNYKSRTIGEPVLEVKQLTGHGLSSPASLAVRRGEIVGVFGLVGAGRTELLNLIYGVRRPQSGELTIEGKRVQVDHPADAIRAGIVLCPEDRKALGIVPVRSVKENVNLSARRNWLRLGLFINEKWERTNAREQVAKLRIKTPSLEQRIVNLSGGNQQKAVLARWLAERIKVILFDEPTRGIDVGAKSEIYSIMTDLAEKGVGMLVVSSELPEVLGIADRILVMRQGAIVASLTRAEATRERVLELALPVSEAAGKVVAGAA